jgi:hypothetical protein
MGFVIAEGVSNTNKDQEIQLWVFVLIWNLKYTRRQTKKEASVLAESPKL